MDLILPLNRDILINQYILTVYLTITIFILPIRGRLAAMYRSKLWVAPKDKDASLVILSVSGSVPQQEADYLNKLMEVYINNGLELKKEIAEKTISFINNQLIIISDSLEKSAAKLESFRLANRFIKSRK